MNVQQQITLPVEFDGDYCGSCKLAIHASYGFICAAFMQILEKEKMTTRRCPKCHYEFDVKSKELELLD